MSSPRASFATTAADTTFEREEGSTLAMLRCKISTSSVCEALIEKAACRTRCSVLRLSCSVGEGEMRRELGRGPQSEPHRQRLQYIEDFPYKRRGSLDISVVVAVFAVHERIARVGPVRAVRAGGAPSAMTATVFPSRVGRSPVWVALISLSHASSRLFKTKTPYGKT